MPESLATLFATWKSVLTRPRDFFADLDLTGGYGEPALFFTSVVLVNSAVGIAFLLARQGLSGSILVQMAFSWIVIAILFAGVVTLVQFLAVRMGGSGDFEATLRAVSFSNAPNLLFWIPFVGILPLLYGAALQTIALAAVHQISPVKAAPLTLPWLALFAGINLALYAAVR